MPMPLDRAATDKKADLAVNLIYGGRPATSLEDVVEGMARSLGGLEGILANRRRRYQDAINEGNHKLASKMEEDFFKLITELEKKKSYDARTKQEMLSRIPRDQLYQLLHLRLSQAQQLEASEQPLAPDRHKPLIEDTFHSE